MTSTTATLAQVSESLASRTQQSASAFQQACQVLPGGVNSPVRAFKSVGGHPLFIQRAEGAYVWDVDGNQYIDYVGSYGPAILGHAHPKVVSAVQEAAARGLTYGAPTELETELAQKVLDRVPTLEMVRFVNSGTEAVMSAIRLARAATERTKLVKFTGCYHGHVDALLVKAGSGAATLGVPDSAGVPGTLTENTLTAPYNDLEAVKSLFQACGSDIAAVLVEPVAGNMGCVPPVPGFLQGLRELCTAHGAMLVFDEVMTGFRVHSQSAQGLYGVNPDITALGKIIGGGMPVGAYGASKTLMNHVAPLGPMYQAGTLSGNPLAMASGLATLTALEAPDVYDILDQRTATLANGLKASCERHNIPAQVTQVGSMVSLFFTDTPVIDYETVQMASKERFNRYFWGMMERGVYLAPSAFEAGFVSLAHTDEVIQKTLDAADATISTL